MLIKPFTGICSQEIREIIPVPLRRVRATRSSTHSHPFQVSRPNLRTLSHKSPFISEHAIHGTSCPLLAFLNLPTFKSFESKINKLDLISLLLAFRFLLSSFVGALYRPPWPFPNTTHYKNWSILIMWRHIEIFVWFVNHKVDLSTLRNKLWILSNDLVLLLDLNTPRHS